MASTAYKTVFSEYHHGPTSFIHMLSKPIAPTRDVAIYQDDTDKLKEATVKSAKKSTQSWILFFDKADALFSSCSEVKEEHQEYANQDVSYVVKCLSQYPGLLILSLTEKPKLEIIQYAVDSIIAFR